MRILIVEDDELLAEGIAVSLSLAGYTADCVSNGEHAVHALTQEQFDLCILDLGLPRLSGYEVLKQIRAKNINLPVLILTARDQTADKVKGLDYGADDYLLKPFDVEELKARIRALTRRSTGQASTDIQVGAVTIKPETHQVLCQGEDVKLSPKEFKLLHELAMHRHRILSKDQLTELVYGWSEEVDSNAIEVHIHNLRKKLGSGIIETLRGIGYRMP